MRKSYALLPNARASLAQKLAQLDIEAANNPPSYEGLAFGEQRRAIECLAPAVLLCCSGRAGKTRAFCLKWLQVCERKPGQISVYVALTRSSAKRVAWSQLKQIDRELGLGLSFAVADLTITHTNGSQLIMLGANRDDLIDVLRGFPIALIGFDEAAFFREDLLRRAIEDAVLVRLMDLEGELWVMSTPGYVCAGYHHDAWIGEIAGFEVFGWSFFDNPHLPLGHQDQTPEWRRQWREDYAVTEMTRKGWTEQTPSYVRDFRGLYRQDTEALVYGFRRDRDMVDAMPESWNTHRERWVVVIGEDFGSTNATAWVCWAFEKGRSDCYCFLAFKHYGMAPSLCADETLKLQEAYHPAVIVGDSAAKGYIDEHRVRHQIAIVGADKQGKRAHQITMNDAFTGGRIHLLKGETEAYASELEKLGKNPAYDKRHPKYGEEDPRGEKDAVDAGLYGWIRCYAWLEEIEAAADRAKKAAADRARSLEYPAANTAFAQMYRRPNKQQEGLRGLFGVANLPKRR